MKKIFLLLVLFLVSGVSAFAAAPTCTSFSFTASTVGASLIQYQCSDTDGDALTFATASGPSHGTITGLNTSTGYFVYTPTAAYTGSDTITFHVTANSQTSSDATLSITVTNAKTRIVDTLLDPSGAARSGKVTFILTQKVTSPAGLIPVSSTVTGVLNSSGQFDVSVYPSSSLSPTAYYQVWFESSTGQRELLGVYNIPASSASSITLAANQVTNTNLAAQYTFLSASAINSIMAGGVSGVTSFEGRSGSVTGSSGDYTASEVTNVAAGTVAATNVQTAINELDTEKIATGSSASLNRLTMTGSTTTAAPPSLGASSSTRAIFYDSGLSDGEHMSIGVESGALWLNNLASGKYNFYFGGVKKIDISASAFTPATDNAFDFGNSSKRFRNLYLSGGITVGSDATGDIYYRTSGGIFTRLGIGSNGDCLTVSSGLPAWGTCATGGSGITSLGSQTGSTQTFANDTNVTISSSSNTHTLGWTGQLAVSRGGTGAATLTGILKGNGTSAFTTATAGTDYTSPSSTESFTNKTLTSSTNVLGGVTLTLGSDATADMYYRNSGGVLTRLAIGSNGNCLTISSGLPAWGSCGGGGGSPGGSSGNVQYNDGAGGFAGSGMISNLSSTAPQINDSSGNELLKFSKTNSAVNEITISNAATGNPPTITTTGGDTDVDLRITPKGSGIVEIRQATPTLKFFNTAGGFTALQIVNSAVTAQGGQDLSLSGNGSSINLTDTNSAGTVNYTTNVRAAYNATSPSQITANQNDYAAWSGAGKAVNMRASTDASRNVTGASAGVTGEFHYIWNVGSFDIVIKHQDAGSTAANRFLNSTGADITITPNRVALMMYDATTARWRVTLLP